MNHSHIFEASSIRVLKVKKPLSAILNILIIDKYVPFGLRIYSQDKSSQPVK